MYASKGREVLFSLRGNKSLLPRLLEGSITDFDIINKSHDDLATDEEKKKKEDLLKEAFLSLNDTAQKKGLKEVAKSILGEKSGGMYSCRKCKSTDTEFTEMQTRSADEPMTQFHVCNACGNRWKN